MRNWSENQITLVLIRHGAAKANEEHRYLGKTDEALSKEGEMQLLEYKKLLLFPDIDLLFTSPMKRCVQTAKMLYPKLPPVPVKEWEEMDFGAFEGKNYIELQGDERYQAWIDSNGELPFPEGESREEFIARCDKGFQKMIEKVKQMIIDKKGHKTIGIIVHGYQDEISYYSFFFRLCTGSAVWRSLLAAAPCPVHWKPDCKSRKIFYRKK